MLGILHDEGPVACSFSRVADRASVERSTLYRRYASRWGMIAEAAVAQALSELALEPSGDFRADMTAHLRRIARSLDSQLGRSMIAAAASARLERQPDGGQYWKARRQQLQPLIDAAVANGQIVADVTAEDLFADSDGPLFFLLLIVGRSPTEADVERIVANLWERYGLPGETAS